jgi:putative membrane protein
MFGLTVLIADTSDGGWHHDHWFLFPLLWLIVIALAIFFWRRGCGGPRRRDPARSVLAERYARGEITIEEYLERLGHLDARP